MRYRITYFSLALHSPHICCPTTLTVSEIPTPILVKDLERECKQILPVSVCAYYQF